MDVPDWGLASQSGFGYGHWSLVHPCSEFWLYLHFEGAKNIHVLEVLKWGFVVCWRFLAWVWHRNPDLDIVKGVWYTHFLNFSSLSQFWRFKEHPCPLSPHLELWRTLEVHDFGSASWSWFWYGLLVFDTQMFQILALYLAFAVTKNIHIFQGLLGALEDAWE